MTKCEKNIYINSSNVKQQTNLSLQEPFFSIITPVFNGEKYLKNYFNELISQNFTNFEVIVIDDGSQDSTLSIIKNYQTKLPQLKLLQQANSGQGVARNKALEAASGNYILFIDSDDSLTSSSSLQQLYNYLSQNPSDVTIFAYQKVYGNKIFKVPKKQTQLLQSNSATTVEQKKI